MRFSHFFSFWAYPTAGILLPATALLLDPDPPWFALIGLFFSGLLLWTLIEYGLHRFVFHWLADAPRLRGLLLDLHNAHHDDPRNSAKILVKPLFSVPISALLLGVSYLILGSFSQAVIVLVGIWSGFLYYEIVHYRVHLAKGNRGLLRYQRRRHFYHHFVDSRYCFGVTSPLWDWIFRTYRT